MPTNPPVVFDEQTAISRVAAWVAQVREKLENSSGRLEFLLQQSLREGSLEIAVKTVEAADKGDEIADTALRQVAAELQPHVLQQGPLAPGHLQIIAYLQRVATRAPLRRGAGRYPSYGVFCRNIGICVLISLACAEFDIQPTRNRGQRRAGHPSGVSLVAAGLSRNRINLDERTIQDKIWFGVAGALVKRTAAERLIKEFFPYHFNSG